MFHRGSASTVCKCKVIVQGDTCDNSERSESTQCYVASGVWERHMESLSTPNIATAL